LKDHVIGNALTVEQAVSPKQLLVEVAHRRKLLNTNLLF
jgi:hypothetical protein